MDDFFGPDSGSEEEVDAAAATAVEVRSQMMKNMAARALAAGSRRAASVAAASCRRAPEAHAGRPDYQDHPATLPEWVESPEELYLGHLKISFGLEEIGGGRGFVATENLRAGTLVLAESAFRPLILPQASGLDRYISSGAASW